MVVKNTKADKLGKDKVFAVKDTSYSSFWLYNRERDINSKHYKDSFVNFYDDRDTLSEFNPTVAKNIISFWSDQGDVIFDPFSGRTRSLVSYGMGRNYIGCEVSNDVITYMLNKYSELGLLEKDNFSVDIINDDCININEHYPEMKYDLVFSCPPYWNLEKYESCPGQLSDISKYDIFIEELGKRLDVAVLNLKKDKYMCMVVGDFRRNKKYITFHADLINRMKENESLVLHDVIAIQNLPFHTAAFYFGKSKAHKHTAKAHEYLLIWKKV